jgi:3-oxoacyl-[acyl-carrier protein] reductase
MVWYNGSKGAAIVTSRAMAVELAPDKIRVNVVNPVAGDTPLLAEFMGSDTPEMRAKFVASIPLGRLSKPIDIANACLYLASDEAGFHHRRLYRSGWRAMRLNCTLDCAG